jgi:hypothetical protein
MDFRAFIVRAYLSLNLGFPGSVPASPYQAPVTIPEQGIEGTARRISGNHMPSPRYPPSDQGHPANPGTVPLPSGTHATICVFRLTNQTQVIGAGKTGFYRSVQTLLVRQADTDDSGRFRILLPPGTYSVFTKKGSLFYATIRDEKNNIAPVEVLPGKMTRVDCSVKSDHAAIY